MAARGTQIERLKLRFISDLEAEEAATIYRVRFNGRDYNILSCVEDLTESRRMWMILTIEYNQGERTLTAAQVAAANAD